MSISKWWVGAGWKNDGMEALSELRLHAVAAPDYYIYKLNANGSTSRSFIRIPNPNPNEEGKPSGRTKSRMRSFLIYLARNWTAKWIFWLPYPILLARHRQRTESVLAFLFCFALVIFCFVSYWCF